MTEEQIFSIKEYYNEKYGTPTDRGEAVNKLTSIYRDLFDEVPSREVREGIAEYYRIIDNRSLPAYEWLLEALHVTSKKEQQKRNFNYAVGMVRTWMKYGFGHIPNSEEDEIVEYFEEVTEQKVSVQSRKVLQEMMGKYGAIKVTRMINSLKEGTDMSLIFMLQLKTNIENKFDTCDEE